MYIHAHAHTHTHTQIYTGVSLPEKSSFSGSSHAFKPNLPSALSLSQAQLLLHRVGSLPEHHTSRLTSGYILAKRAQTQVEWWRFLLAQCCCSSPCLPPLPPQGQKSCGLGGGPGHPTSGVSTPRQNPATRAEPLGDACRAQRVLGSSLCRA